MTVRRIGEATLICSDVVDGLRSLPDESVHCVVTSPPYWGLRDYGIPGQIGLEGTPEEYIARMVHVFREVRRVLRDDGTLWLNIGDSYAGGGRAGNNPEYFGKHTMFGKTGWDPGVFGRPQPVPSGLKPKDLVGIPWRLAFALQADGWYLRSDIIWSKPNPMPESVTDRPTKAHEYIFLLTKSPRYFYDAEAIKEPASEDTQARYARGRSNHHKYADGGPGNQTIARTFEHMRAAGVNPKCAEPGSGIKQNSSFAAAVKDIVGKRNKRTVWTVSTQQFAGAHFATFPQALIEPCILAGCPEGETVLDPFGGSGTVTVVALKKRRKAISIELNPEYFEMECNRLRFGTVDDVEISEIRKQLTLFDLDGLEVAT